MNYFNIINDSIDFIEDEIKSPIVLEQLADRAFLSKYHFTRIFKALTNKTPKEYIDERKLTEAAIALRNMGGNIVDVAYEYGFESHEAFSRRFKSMFGVTPLEVKKGLQAFSGFNRLEVVERDFTNNSKCLFPSFSIHQIAEQVLIGKKARFNPLDDIELKNVTKSVKNFVHEVTRNLIFDSLYCVVQGEADENSCINYFYGIATQGNEWDFDFETAVLPSSEYAVFNYTGDFANIFETVFTDVCKALLFTEKELNKNEIELFEVYDKYYDTTKKFSVYVPVK